MSYFLVIICLVTIASQARHHILQNSCSTKQNVVVSHQNCLIEAILVRYTTYFSFRSVQNITEIGLLILSYLRLLGCLLCLLK